MKSQMPKRTQLGLDLEQAAKEILAHLQGELTLPTRVVVLPEKDDTSQTSS